MDAKQLAQQTLRRLTEAPGERLRLANIYGFHAAVPRTNLIIILGDVPTHDHQAIERYFNPRQLMVIKGVIADEP